MCISLRCQGCLLNIAERGRGMWPITSRVIRFSWCFRFSQTHDQGVYLSFQELCGGRRYNEVSYECTSMAFCRASNWRACYISVVLVLLSFVLPLFLSHDCSRTLLCGSRKMVVKGRGNLCRAQLEKSLGSFLHYTNPNVIDVLK